MTKSELYPNTFKDMNKEFQYLWEKYGRDDWHAENLGDYCANLEYMIMNYLDRNRELGPIKSTASDEKEDELDAPGVFFENYDYIDQNKKEKEKTKFGPGGGIYNGEMDKYKSVKDFVDTDRKMRRKQRKKKLAHLLNSLASGIIGDVEIPKEVLEKIKKDKEEDKEEDEKPKEESEEITQDGTITGIPFANRTDAGPSYDELLTYPNGALFDNDTMKNTYYGIYSLQGNEKIKINNIFKFANMYNFLCFAGKVDDLQLKYPEFKNQIQYLSDNDPTGNNKYLDYAVKVLVSKQALEREIVDVIDLFHKNYNKLENKDINSYKSFTELRDLLFSIDDKKSKTQEKKDIKQTGTEKIYEDDKCIILLIKNKNAACHYGFGTKWCITMSEEKYYENYTDNNDVFYFLISKNNYANKKMNAIHTENQDYDKIAIDIKRDLNNKVINIECFDAHDNQIGADLGDIYDNWNNISSLIFTNAANQPKSEKTILFQKVQNGTATLDEIFDNLNDQIFNEFLRKYDDVDMKDNDEPTIYPLDYIAKLYEAINNGDVKGTRRVKQFLMRHE